MTFDILVIGLCNDGLWETEAYSTAELAVNQPGQESQLNTENVKATTQPDNTS